MDEQSWSADLARRRRARALRVALAVVTVAAIAVGFAAVRHSGPSDQVSASAPGFRSDARSIDTTPFDPAAPDRVGGPTTIPGGPGGNDLNNGSGTTSTSSTTTTTTTVPIPPPPDDPSCKIATEVVKGLRIVSGPAGTTPANLAATADRFRAAADIVDSSGLPSSQSLASILRNIAAEIPSATSVDDVLQIYQQLQTPNDPRLRAAVAQYADQLMKACPYILAIKA